MLHVATALLFLQLMPGAPVRVGETKTDPFTDEFRLAMVGVGAEGKLRLGSSCSEKDERNWYSLSFHIESDEAFATFGGEDGSSMEWQLGSLRFDNGDIEPFRFKFLLGSLWLGWPELKDGERLRDDSAHKLVLRFPHHDRLRIQVVAAKDIVFEDFDISEVTTDTLETLCTCAHEPNPCVSKQD